MPDLFTSWWQADDFVHCDIHRLASHASQFVLFVCVIVLLLNMGHRALCCSVLLRLESWLPLQVTFAIWLWPLSSIGPHSLVSGAMPVMTQFSSHAPLPAMGIPAQHQLFGVFHDVGAHRAESRSKMGGRPLRGGGCHLPRCQ